MPDWLSYTIVTLVIIAVITVVLWRLSPILFFGFRAISTQGRISNWMSMKEKGVTYFYPVISFETLEGEKKSFRADDRCEERPMYPIGTTVTVRYDKKDTTNVRTEYPES